MARAVGIDLGEPAIRDAGMSPRDVDHVVLVGGSTRMPAIGDPVRGLTGPDRDQLEAAVSDVTGALAGSDVAAITAATDRLATASSTFGARLHRQPADAGPTAGGAAWDGDAVDAEVVDEESRA